MIINTWTHNSTLYRLWEALELSVLSKQFSSNLSLPGLWSSEEVRRKDRKKLRWELTPQEISVFQAKQDMSYMNVHKLQQAVHTRKYSLYMFTKEKFPAKSGVYRQKVPLAKKLIANDACCGREMSFLQ